MDAYRRAEELMDFVRLVHRDRQFKVYAKDLDKLFRLVSPYAFIDPTLGSEVDWERLSSFCEYFLVKWRFDPRQSVQRTVLPSALYELAWLTHAEGYRRALLRSIAYSFAAYAAYGLPETLRPPPAKP